MGIEQVGWSILGRTVAEILSPRLVSWLTQRQLMPGRVRFWLDKKSYLQDIPNRLKRMPFIYAGVETDVLNDFVEIDIDRLDPGTLSKRKKICEYRVDYRDLLRDRRLVFIVGYAGIGKTTFQRHSVLRTVQHRSDFMHGSERLLPIYVPLKLVKNAGKTPILAHLIKSPPFNGDRRALVRVASSDGLFLCLDGYDEIALTGSSENYIQKELAQLLFPGERTEKHRGIDIYQIITARSRIWLTSRPQFLQYHPVGPIGGRTNSTNTKVATVEILGIGSNREALVQRVFDRYCSAHVDVSHLLNAEYFLQHLDQAADGEILSMSFNPLFLTVMCYNYAQKVLDNNRYDVQMEPTFELLILKCIDLLLVDIDEYKARDFSPVQRQAIANRRNQFIEQKKAFLTYLAASSYVKVTNFYTEDSLRNILFEFLDGEGAIEDDGAIRQTFVHPTSDRPSFIRQLIYCGVFVLVDAADGAEFYDFPHRRFKEVLAASYFSCPERYFEFLVEISSRDRSSLVELITVLKRSSKIQGAQLQQGALSLMLERVLEKGTIDRQFIAVSEAYLEMLPEATDISREMGKFVRRCVEMRRPEFEVSGGLLRHYRIDLPAAYRIEQHTREGCKRGDERSVAVGLSILKSFNAPRAVELAIELQQYPDLTPNTGSVLWWTLLQTDASRFARQVLANPASIGKHWLLFDMALAHGGSWDIAIVQSLFTPLDRLARTYFLLYASQLFRNDDWLRLTEPLDVRWDIDLLTALRAGFHHKLDLPVYFVSSTAASLLGLILDKSSAKKAVIFADGEVHQVSLALRNEARSKRYAYIEEGVAKAYRLELERGLPQQNFLRALDDVFATIDRTVQRIFSEAKFSITEDQVAFTQTSTYTEASLSKALRERAVALFTVSAEECTRLAEAWKAVASPVPQFPRFFV